MSETDASSGDRSLAAGRVRVVRLSSYAALAGALVAIYPFLVDSSWRGDTGLHTGMEQIATLGALTVGSLALVRFYAKKQLAFLFVGLGFVGTALLDGYHSAVTSGLPAHIGWSPSSSVIAWSWSASQAFLAITLLLSVRVWERDPSDQAKISEKCIYWATGVLALCCLYVFVFVPLPPPHHPEFFFGRPQELVPAGLFGLALWYIARQGSWMRGRFEHMLVLALITSVISQALFMSRSFALFDAMFDAAHGLKILSYAFVLVGLELDIYMVFAQAEETARIETQAREQLSQVVKELGTEKRLLRTLIDNTPDLVYVKDTDSRFLVANQALAEQVGVAEPAQLLGKSDFDFHPEEYSAAYYAREQQIIRTGEALVAHEESVVRKDGSIGWYSSTKAPLRDEKGEIVGFVGIGRDITEDKRVEDELARAYEGLEARVAERTRDLSLVVDKLRTANQELDSFVHVASHDLQEPLRNLIAYSSMLREDLGETLPEQAAQDLQFITEASARMRKLVEDLLTMSRAGRATLNIEPVQVDECVDASLEALRTRLDESGARLKRNSLPEVNGDRTLLTQVFQNLLSNSMKFIGPDEPAIEITVEKRENEWVFGVKDNGIGLPPEHGEQIFAPFKRLHGHSEYEGSGIGLSICRKAIERHKGTIWVESEPGKGAHFRFTLPVESPQEQ